MLRRLYDWVIHWAETPYGGWALFVLAFAESSFFPIPPDPLLIVLVLGAPKKAFRYALICTAGSVLGGLFGYLIGVLFMEGVGMPIIHFYGLESKFEHIRMLYQKYDAWAVGIAGFTPIPYKVFTIAAGAFNISIPVFLAASAISRAGRFFLVALVLYAFGPKIKPLIERYFNLLSIVFVILLIAGFIVMKYIAR